MQVVVIRSPKALRGILRRLFGIQKTVKKIPSLLVGGGILLHNTPFYCVRAL